MQRNRPYYQTGDTIYHLKTRKEVRIMSILANSKNSDERWEDFITIPTNFTRTRRWFHENNWEIKDV